MLTVLIIWCYIFATGFHLGFLVDKMLRLQLKDFALTTFCGLFTTMLIASSWAIFGRINVEFHAFLLLANVLIFFKWKPEITTTYLSFFQQLKDLSKKLKLFLIVISILLIAVCAAPTFFIDNEIYYIQTIKWLNEYGFVKGLANLHLFFGQTSGWHVLQSAFNFSFLDFGGNCLNGFCLLLGNLYAISHFQSSKLIRLLPLGNLLLFAFVSIPSPDLAVCILSFVVFCYALEHFKNLESNHFNLIFILSVFVVFVKITAVPILLLPGVLWVLNFRKLSKKSGISYIIGLFTFGLFVIKNCILTGLPMYPLSSFKEIPAFDFVLPDAIYDFSFNSARLYDFIVSKSEFDKLNVFELFAAWLSSNAFNVIIILLILVAPIFIRRFYNQKISWILYAIMVVQLFVLLVTSPQYRFILHFVMFLGLLIASRFIQKERFIIPLFYLSLLPMLILFIYPKWQIHSNNAAFHSTTFSVENMLIPSKDSNLNTTYKTATIGNLQYHSPDATTYIWATGNGELPCVNQKQIQYFKQHLGYIPQLRTSEIRDGFYSQKISQ